MDDPWMQLDVLLKLEVHQRREEGCDPSPLEEQISQVTAETPREEVNALYDALMALLPSEDFPYVEPSDLEAIREQRPDGPRQLSIGLSDEMLQDRFLGAWQGRCAGCELGKPVEGWPRERIESYLKLIGDWPLDDFFRAVDPMPEGYAFHPSWPDAVRGRIRFMARDDDIDYTILGTHILKTFGPGFTTEDVGRTWLFQLPYWQVYTAERVAYRNMVNNIPLNQVATYRNPFREWIGAQIRADGLGYAAAGWPEKAAEFAYRDAALSHVKNGIYGEMWVAAMLAAAFTATEVSRDAIKWVIEVGLSEIPARSRLAEAIRQVMTWSDEYASWEQTWDRINESFGRYHWVHTINNAALVAMGLLYGEGDLERSIAVAVMGGWDTDCNGATVGSIVGAMNGARRLPAKWVGPFRDTVRSYVIGYDNSRISELAQQSFMLWQQIRGDRER